MASSAERYAIVEVSAARADDVIADLANCLMVADRAREFAEGLNVDFGLDNGRCLWCGHLRLFSVGASFGVIGIG